MPDFAYVGLDTAGRERRGSVRADYQGRSARASRFAEGSMSSGSSLRPSRHRPAARCRARVRAPQARHQAADACSPASSRRWYRSRRSKRRCARSSPQAEQRRGPPRPRQRPRRRRRGPSPRRCDGARAEELSAALPRDGRRRREFGHAAANSRAARRTCSSARPQFAARCWSTLAYPVMLAIVAAIVVFALMIFVVPKVVEQFDDMGQQLPLLTRIVIGLSEFLSNWWWALLLAAAAPVLLAGRALRDEALRLKFDRCAAPPAADRPADPRPSRGAHGAHSVDHGREPPAAARRAPADHADRPQPGASRARPDEIAEIVRDRRQPVRRAAPRRDIPAAARLSGRVAARRAAGSI